jgi:putative transposase
VSNLESQTSPNAHVVSDPLCKLAIMKMAQQELPLPLWGGAREGAGRKQEASRPQVAHGRRDKFRNAALHVTMRVRCEVWNLRTRPCFAAVRQAFEGGCARFGFRVIHF